MRMPTLPNRRAQHDSGDLLKNEPRAQPEFPFEEFQI